MTTSCSTKRIGGALPLLILSALILSALILTACPPPGRVQYSYRCDHGKVLAKSDSLPLDSVWFAFKASGIEFDKRNGHFGEGFQSQQGTYGFNFDAWYPDFEDGRRVIPKITFEASFRNAAFEDLDTNFRADQLKITREDLGVTYFTCPDIFMTPKK